MNIVTLLPSATEIVCALGLEASIVAVSHECDYPSHISSRPSITSSILPDELTPLQVDEAVVNAVRAGDALYQVDGDLLSQLKPDLIITQGVCDVCAVDIGTVNQTMRFLPDVLSSQVQILSLSGSNFAGVMRDIKQVAEAAGVQAQGDELVEELQSRWRAVEEAQPAAKPTVAMLEWPDPYFFGGHWVPEMVEAAGGIDVLGQAGVASGRFTSQDLIEKDPDMIVSIACGFGLEKNAEFALQILQNPAFQQLKAVKNRNVWAMDANSYCSRPAPRVVDGAEKLLAAFKNSVDGIEGIRRL